MRTMDDYSPEEHVASIVALKGMRKGAKKAAPVSKSMQSEPFSPEQKPVKRTAKGAFAKGTAPGPGRPSFAQIAARFLDEESKIRPGFTRDESRVIAGITKAEGGDLAWSKELSDRIEGAVAQTVDIGVSSDSARERLARSVACFAADGDAPEGDSEGTPD